MKKQTIPARTINGKEVCFTFFLLLSIQAVQILPLRLPHI